MKKSILAFLLALCLLFISGCSVLSEDRDNEGDSYSESSFSDNDTSETSETTKVYSDNSYKIQFYIYYEPNIVFSIYDVDIFIDDEKVSVLKQDEVFDELFTLSEGIHKVTFSKTGDNSIKGETTIELLKDEAFLCIIHAHSDEIEITDKTEESLEEYKKRTEEQETTESIETTVPETTKKPNKNKNQSKSSKIPIDVPKGYSRLQAFFLKCTEDTSKEELESLAKKCGLYVNVHNYPDYAWTLEISEEELSSNWMSMTAYDDYAVDCINVRFEDKGEGAKFDNAYYFLADGIANIEFQPDGMLLKDGKIVPDKYYVISNDSTVRYYSAKEVMDACIKEFK